MAFGFVGPDQYMVTPQATEVEEAVEEAIPEGPLFMISILANSAEQGNPDYEPGRSGNFTRAYHRMDE